MAKYKICFSGFAYVEAEDRDEAIELFDDDLDIFREQSIDSVTEVDEFVVEV